MKRAIVYLSALALLLAAPASTATTAAEAASSWLTPGRTLRS